MTVNEFRDRISEIPVFQTLPSSLRLRLSDVLVGISSERTLEAGGVLYEKGTEDENTGAIVVQGALEVHTDPDHVFQISAPNIVGEMQQLNEFGQRTATVLATEKAILLDFSWHDFVRALTENVIITDSERAQVKALFKEFAGDRLKELMD